MLHLGNILNISGHTAPIVDCIIGGSPCQDLSVAGKRAGLDGERSGLYIEQVRIVKEMRAEDERNGRTGVDIRPRYMVWENVPGAFSSNKGDDFRIVLEELAKVKDKDAVIPMPDGGKWTNYGCIMGDGWSIAWRVLDAQFWGVPQRRRRIALVADFGGQSAPEILFVRKSVSGDIDESKPKRKEAPSDATGGFGADDRLGADQYNAVILGDTVSTLGVNCGMSHGRQCVLEPVCFEPGIASREGGHIYEGVSGTLRANAGDNQMATAYSVENHPNDSRVGINEDGIVQALTSRMGTGGGNVPLVMESKSNFIDVEMEVAVRKYEVNKDLLQECLRDHKGNFTNKEIATALDKPLTLVEHWFRRDSSFAIPDADIWYKLKELLGIETSEFDQSIMEFEFKSGNYDMRNRIHVGDTAPTLTCGSGNNLHLVPMVMQCYSKSKRAQSATDNETWVESDKANTLNAFDVGDVRTTECVVYQDTVGALCARDYKGVGSQYVDENKGVANCLNTNDMSEGRVNEIIVTAIQPVIALDRASYNQGKNAQYDFEVSDKGINSPLVAKGPGAVCYSFDPTASRDAGDYILDGVSNPLINGTCPGHKRAVCYQDFGQKSRYIVRRLTPLECERLQGYPDGWTDIGDWIDSNGKKRQTSDAARYKALGNSIALPPWKWVLKRLCACYERDATMASLFDGIGGFPYLWEQLNGKGTCLWASEIEEFPIAVTKVRIGE